MIFFLDENFPKSAKKVLELLNYSVIDIRGTKDEGLSDLFIFDLAKENRAIFLTTDKDFFHTIHFNSKPHFGIVVIALNQPNTDKILNKLQWFLENIKISKDIENTCYVISDNKCKIFK